MREFCAVLFCLAQDPQPLTSSAPDIQPWTEWLDDSGSPEGDDPFNSSHNEAHRARGYFIILPPHKKHGTVQQNILRERELSHSHNFYCSILFYY